MITIVALILWFCITCYAVLGGADYGAGFWDLTAGGARRGARTRALIEHAMTPVWEANNVWLIFALVVLWTGFPRGFAAITSTLFVPLSLAAAGIVLRGCGFVFRDAIRELGGRRLAGSVFALSSLMTPFFLGAGFGAIASGRVHAAAASASPLGWVGPTSILVGLLAVFVRGVPRRRRSWCSTRAACSTRRSSAASRVARSAAPSSRARWRSSACSWSAATRLISIEGCSTRDSRWSSCRVSAAIGAITLLVVGFSRGVRALAVGAVVAMLAAWGLGQWPYLLPTSLTVTAAAGAPATLVWLLVMFMLAAVIVIPALGLLFTLDQRSRLQQGAAMAGQARDQRHRVVVVGGGFGGLFATRALGWSPVDVTLVDRQPHHLFQPMLYQVATGIVSEGEVAPPLRHILRYQENAAVLLAEVTGFDLPAARREGRSARTASPISIPYDSLIVAAGARRLVLRPRRAGGARARHEDAGRRAPAAEAAAAGAGDGRAVRRSPATGRLADGRHRGRRRDRCRDRRSDPRAGRAHPRRQLPADQSRAGAGPADRRGSRTAAPVRRSTVGDRRRASSGSWASSCGWASRSPRSTPRASSSKVRPATNGSRRAR